jgi:hypothetical protein
VRGEGTVAGRLGARPEAGLWSAAAVTPLWLHVRASPPEVKAASQPPHSKAGFARNRSRSEKDINAFSGPLSTIVRLAREDERLDMQTYPRLRDLIVQVLDECQKCGLGDQLAKGGLSTILLANRLGHTIVPGDKKADAKDADGKQYEYKVTLGNQMDFNFGPRKKKSGKAYDQTIKKHFQLLEGAYCGVRKGGDFARIAYCPSKTLVPFLIAHFAKVGANQLTANLPIETILGIEGAQEIR